MMKKESSEYETLALEVFNIQNKLRTDPKSFIPILENELSTFKGKVYKAFDQKGNIISEIMTKEGPTAVRECIRYLQKVKPVSSLTLNKYISKAARDHGMDMNKHNFMGHDSSNGKSLGDRVQKYGNAYYFGENISYGWADPLQIILSLLVDDGVPDRGHRLNIFESGFKMCGIYAGPHSSIYKHSCIIDFAKDFSPKDNLSVHIDPSLKYDIKLVIKAEKEKLRSLDSKKKFQKINNNQSAHSDNKTSKSYEILTEVSQFEGTRISDKKAVDKLIQPKFRF